LEGKLGEEKQGSGARGVMHGLDFFPVQFTPNFTAIGAAMDDAARKYPEKTQKSCLSLAISVSCAVS